MTNSKNVIGPYSTVYQDNCHCKFPDLFLCAVVVVEGGEGGNRIEPTMHAVCGVTDKNLACKTAVCGGRGVRMGPGLQECVYVGLTLFLCFLLICYPYILLHFQCFFILVHVTFFSSRCMLELKFAIYYRAASLPSQASYAVLAEESQAFFKHWPGGL